MCNVAWYYLFIQFSYSSRSKIYSVFCLLLITLDSWNSPTQERRFPALISDVQFALFFKYPFIIFPIKLPTIFLAQIFSLWFSTFFWPLVANDTTSVRKTQGDLCERRIQSWIWYVLFIEQHGTATLRWADRRANLTKFWKGYPAFNQLYRTGAFLRFHEITVAILQTSVALLISFAVFLCPLLLRPHPWK